MSTEQCIQALWEAHQRGDFFPQAWRGKLELPEAYRVQLGLLDRKLARGERQAGWKVGLTADVMREMFGGKEPVFGYLLESGSVASGHAFRFAELRTPMVENELLVTLAQDLSGPGATAQDARRAVGTIAPALESVSSAGRMLSTPEISATAARTAMRSRGSGLTAWVLRCSEVRVIGMTLPCGGQVGNHPHLASRRPPGAGSMD